MNTRRYCLGATTPTSSPELQVPSREGSAGQSGLRTVSSPNTHHLAERTGNVWHLINRVCEAPFRKGPRV